MHYKELKKAWSDTHRHRRAVRDRRSRCRGQKPVAHLQERPALGARGLAFDRRLWRPRLRWSTRDDRLTYAEAHAKVNAIAAWMFARWREARRPRRHRHAQLSRLAADLLGLRLHRRGDAVGMNAWWVAEEIEVCGEGRRARRSSSPTPNGWTRILEKPGVAGEALLVAVRTDAPRTSVIPLRGRGGAAAARCRWSASIPTPTPASSPPPARPAFRRSAQLTHRGCVANLMNMGFSSGPGPGPVLAIRN